MQKKYNLLFSEEELENVYMSQWNEKQVVSICQLTTVSMKFKTAFPKCHIHRSGTLEHLTNLCIFTSVGS